MSRLTFIIVSALVLVAGAVLYLLQKNAESGLDQANVSLRQQVDQLPSRIEENQRLSNLLAQAQSSPSTSNSQFAELQRLRTEVPARKFEIEQLQVKATASQSALTNETVPFSIRYVNLPKENWSLAGYATPEAALQSMLWATREGDVNELKASLTPDEAGRRSRGEWKNMTDSQIAEVGQQRLGKATGFQILKYESSDPDRMHFTVYVDGFDQSEQPLWMDVRRINGEWKSDAPEYHR